MIIPAFTLLAIVAGLLIWLAVLGLIRRREPPRRLGTRDERVARKQRRLREIPGIWKPLRNREDERIYEESLARVFGLHPQVARDRAERLLSDSPILRRSKGTPHGHTLPSGLATRLREFFVEHGDLEIDYEPIPGRNRIGLGPSYFEHLDDLADHIIIGGSFNEVQAMTYLARVGEEPILEYLAGWLPDERFDPEVDELRVAAPSIDHLVILVLDDWLP